MSHHRNFGLPADARPLPRQPTGEPSKARPFFFDDQDFIAGMFAGLVLAAGPMAVMIAVLFYLP